MVSFTSLSLGLTLFGAQPVGGAHPMVILATHEPATEYEQRLLRLAGDELRQEAEANGYVVRQSDEFTFVRSRNLFNLADVDELNASVGAIVELAGPKERIVRDKETVEKIRAILATTSIAPELGDYLLESKSFLVFCSASVVLTEGGKTVRVDLPSQPGDSLRDLDFVEIQPDRPPKFDKLARPKPYTDALAFTFGPTRAQSDRRAIGSARFAEAIALELERQNVQAATVGAALRAAMTQGMPLPSPGEDFQAFAAKLGKGYSDNLASNHEFYGFRTVAEWQAFLQGARVSSVRISPMVGVGTVVGGNRIIRAASPIPQRNPPAH